MTYKKESPAGIRCATGLGEHTVDLSTCENSPTAKAGNGVAAKSLSPLEVAKAVLPDIFALAAALQWPIHSSGPTFAWYRGNTGTPSLDIKHDGSAWYDFVLGVGGGPIDLLAVVEQLDRRESCRRFMAVAAEKQRSLSHTELIRLLADAQQQYSPEAAEIREIEAAERREEEAIEKREAWLSRTELLTPSDADVGEIVTSRRWPAAAGRGVGHARDLRLLYSVARGGQAGRYVLTDSSRRSAKERRRDGQDILPVRKTMAMPGSQSRWPIGTSAVVAGDHVILVEGETDQLAMFALLAIFSPAALGRTIVVSLAAGSLIHEEAVERFRRCARLVTVVADDDAPGARAVARWTEQLAAAGVAVCSASVAGIADGAKDISDLLSQLNNFKHLSPSLGDWVRSITEASDQQ